MAWRLAPGGDLAHQASTAGQRRSGRISGIIRDAFMPLGWPDSVTPDYGGASAAGLCLHRSSSGIHRVPTPAA
jgi:hypothetical protein